MTEWTRLDQEVLRTAATESTRLCGDLRLRFARMPVWTRCRDGRVEFKFYCRTYTPRGGTKFPDLALLGSVILDAFGIGDEPIRIRAASRARRGYWCRFSVGV